MVEIAIVDILTTGEKIERIRKTFGWTRTEMGRRMGVSSQHIYHLERSNIYLSKKRFHNLEKVVEDHAASQPRMFDEDYSDIYRCLDSIKADLERSPKKRFVNTYFA